MLFNLKNVKIIGCLMTWLEAWSETEFCKLFEPLRFILKNTVVLQKFVIITIKQVCVPAFITID